VLLHTNGKETTCCTVSSQASTITLVAHTLKSPWRLPEASKARDQTVEVCPHCNTTVEDRDPNATHLLLPMSATCPMDATFALRQEPLQGERLSSKTKARENKNKKNEDSCLPAEKVSRRSPRSLSEDPRLPTPEEQRRHSNRLDYRPTTERSLPAETRHHQGREGVIYCKAAHLQPMQFARQEVQKGGATDLDGVVVWSWRTEPVSAWGAT